MVWYAVNLQLEPGEYCIAVLSNGGIEVEWLFHIDLSDRSALLQELHVDGPGPNAIGRSALRELADRAMEQFGCRRSPS
jgi:hypothetical protein